MKYLVVFFLLAITQVFGQAYQILQGYDESSCSGTPVTVIASRNNLCYPQEDDFGGIDYVYNSCNSTATTSSLYYSSSVCAGAPDEVDSDLLDECESDTVDDFGDISASMSCGDEVPSFAGNFITNTYYPTTDCSGDFFYKISYDFSWLGCVGGIKFECTADQEVSVLFCDNDDCSGECDSFGSVPSDTCEEDDEVPGTSYTIACTSGSTSVIASGVLILSALMFNLL